MEKLKEQDEKSKRNKLKGQDEKSLRDKIKKAKGTRSKI